MNYKLLSYLCDYSAMFLILIGFFGDIEFLNYNSNFIKFLFFISAFLLLSVGYKFSKLSNNVLKDIDQYGYLNNKDINIDNISIFREIPCYGDIYYAYFLIKVNNFNFKESNILTAIILKWIKEKKYYF